MYKHYSHVCTCTQWLHIKLIPDYKFWREEIGHIDLKISLRLLFFNHWTVVGEGEGRDMGNPFLSAVSSHQRGKTVPAVQLLKSGPHDTLWQTLIYWSITNLTCIILVPCMDPLLSITNTTFFATLGKSIGAKKWTKYPFTICMESVQR